MLGAATEVAHAKYAQSHSQLVHIQQAAHRHTDEYGTKEPERCGKRVLLARTPRIQNFAHVLQTLIRCTIVYLQ